MRKILDGLKSTDNFVDDVLTLTNNWISQLHELEQLFRRIRRAGLTVKPSKCWFGYPGVEFVGHRVGNCKSEMLEKLEQVSTAPPQRTKKQLRAFLGLSS